MFVYNRQVAAHRAIAMLLALALVLWGVGAHMFTRIADAANITDASDTLSDSAPGSGSNHTIVFTSPNGMVIGQNFTVNFATLFGTTAIDLGDIDLLTNATPQTIATTSAAGVWGVTGVGTDVLTFQTPTNVGAASSTIFTIRVGTNAVTGVAGNEQITNPTATTSYRITIDGSMQDGGSFMVAIVDNVEVTARVETTLAFTVNGVAAGQAVNGSPTTTSTTTTNLRLPFGILTANVSKTLAQDLTVTTNAANGFIVTVEQDTNLLSSTGADIDGFANGSYLNTPGAWVSPTNNIANENTWGHWGITSEDSSLTVGLTDEFGSNLWVAASTTPREIFRHDGPADGSTAHIGRTRIGFQAQITALQEAGDDYNTTLTYIATPTF